MISFFLRVQMHAIFNGLKEEPLYDNCPILVQIKVEISILMYSLVHTNGKKINQNCMILSLLTFTVQTMRQVVKKIIIVKRSTFLTTCKFIKFAPSWFKLK